MAKKIRLVILKIPAAICSFPSLSKPRPPKNNKGKDDAEDAVGKYEITLLLDPNDPKHKATLREVNADIKRAIDEYFEGKKLPMKPLTEVFGDGNNYVSQETGEVVEGYAGRWYIKARALPKTPPRVLRGKEDIPRAEADEVIYAGCKVNATINIWIQDNDHGRAVRFNLRGVQYAGQGIAFGATPAAIEEFDDFDPVDDAEEFGADFG